MRPYNARYNEILPEEYSIAYKSAEQCEKTTFHLHDQLELTYTLSDNLILQTEAQSISIPKHHILLLSCRDLHYLHCEKNTGLCSRYNLYFPPSLVSRFSTPEFNILQCFNIRTGNTPNILQVPPGQQQVFLPLLNDLTCLFQKERYPVPDMDPKLAEQYTKLLLGQLLILTNNLFSHQYHISLTATAAKHCLIASEIAEYIQNNLCNELTADIIAKKFYISKTQLYYLFTEVYGMTLSGYVCELRITKAKNLLINSEYSIDYIAQAAGYQNLASFSRTFKAKTGFSPKKYRIQNTEPNGNALRTSWVNLL